MQKDKKQQILEKIEKHGKVIMPILIVVIVALVVAFALTRGNKDLAAESIEMESVSTQTEEETLETVEETPLVPLVENTDTNIYNLIASYFNAFANGDIETIKSISDYVDDTEIIKIQELSKYIESYPTIKVYTKKGLLDNTYIAYVYYKLTFHNFVDEVPGQQSFYICTREDGSLYLHEGDTDEATLEYMREVSIQDDVVELINQVTVEYNELMTNNPTLFDYISDLYSEAGFPGDGRNRRRCSSSRGGSSFRGDCCFGRDSIFRRGRSIRRKWRERPAGFFGKLCRNTPGASNSCCYQEYQYAYRT